MAETITLEDLYKQVGGGTRTSKWFKIDQSKIDAFADATEDWQFIHVDAEKAANTPFAGTIAHGFLSLSMLSAMAYDTEPNVEGTAMAVNYGMDKVRFIAPVKSGARLRAVFETKDVSEAGSPDRLRITRDVIVEIEGEDKPALKASWIGMLFMNPDRSAPNSSS